LEELVDQETKFVDVVSNVGDGRVFWRVCGPAPFRDPLVSWCFWID